MAVEGFDLTLSEEGDIIVNSETHDCLCLAGDELRIQLAYNRIKSVSTNWFIDEIGADLEYLIGKPCNKHTAETGRSLIENVLTVDGLWDKNDIHIMAEIRNNASMIFSVYLRTYTDEDKDTSITHEITAEIDLVKGVKIKYGWEPRR